MVGHLVETMAHRLRRDEMDRIDDRLRGGKMPNNTASDARHRVTVIRPRGGNGGSSVSEAVYSNEMLRTIPRRVETQRAEEGAMKHFLKSVFLTVSGDINEIG
jgi:hypothetical protein